MTPSESIPMISSLQGQAETRVKSASSQELALAEKHEVRMIGSIEEGPSSVTLQRTPVCAKRLAGRGQGSFTVATKEQQNDRLVVEADSFSRSKVNLENESQNPNDVQMDRNVLLSMAKKQLEIKVLSVSTDLVNDINFATKEQHEIIVILYIISIKTGHINLLSYYNR